MVLPLLCFWDNTLLAEQSATGQVTDLVGGLLPFPLFNVANQEEGKLSFSKALLGAGVEPGSFEYFSLEFQVSADAPNGTTEIAHLLTGNDMSNIVHFGVELMEASPSLVINIQGPVDCPDLGLNIGDACDADGAAGTVDADCQCIADVVVPENDLPCDAIAIECGGSATGSTADATTEGSPTGFCGTTPGSAGGVWYSIIGDGSLVTVSLCGSDYDTKLNIYTGGCDVLECVAGNDDNFTACGAGNNSQLDFAAAAGVEYLIYVNGFSSQSGNFALNVTCVPFDCTDLLANIGDACDDGDDTTINDTVTADCACVGEAIPDAPVNDLACDAIALACDEIVTGNTEFATNSANKCNGTGGNEVWYTFTADAETIVTLETCIDGTDFDTDLSVFTGACDALECFDGFGGGMVILMVILVVNLLLGLQVVHLLHYQELHTPFKWLDSVQRYLETSHFLYLV